MKKIKIAFIKFGGLSAGGTERGLQTVCANLPKDRFDVTYFYCDSAPYIGSDWVHPNTDPTRKAYMESKGVKLVKFDVGFKNVQTPTHTWIDTDFWDVFNENEFDIVQSARAGHPEYPFIHIRNTPIVDLITLPGMTDKQSNIVKSVHISNFQKETWLGAGGASRIAQVIPLLSEMPPCPDISDSIRGKVFDENLFAYGLHQRPDDGIFSPVPLQAYSSIESAETCFVILGGSVRYQDQAKQLGLKNFFYLPPTGDYKEIFRFLAGLNVYAHGRADGETYSMAIAEALRCGLPVVTHPAKAMGHVETFGDAGFVASTIEEYAAYLSDLRLDFCWYENLAREAKKQYKNYISLETNIQKWIEIYEEVYANNLPVEASVETNDWLKEWME